MDKYSSVRAEAAKTIAALSVNPGDVWMQIYRGAQEPLTKAAALRNLARIDPAAVATQIHAAATAMDLPLRKAAAQGLATLGEEKDLAMLRALAGDREVPVRLAVVDACCDMKDAEKAVDIVNLLRRDRDQGVRFKVILEMVRIDSPRVGVLYLAVLRDETVESLRFNAAELIRGAKNASTLLKELRSLVEREKSGEVREALKSTIAAIEQEAADRTKSVGGPGPTVDTGMSPVEEVTRVAGEIRRLRMLHTEAVEKRNWDAAEELAKQMRTAQAAERAILGRLSDQVADAMRQGTVEDVERQGALLDEAYKNTEYSRSRQAGRPPKLFEVDRR